MPRIAAAVTVVIVMGMCIGFNTVRYPAVWKMVAGAHQPPRSEEPAPQSQSLTFSRPEPSGESAAPPSLIPDSSGRSDRSGRSFRSASVDPIPFPSEFNAANDEFSDESDEESSDAASTSSASVAATASDDSTRWPGLRERESVAYESPEESADSYEQASSQHHGSSYGEPDPQPIEAAPSMKYASGAADPAVREKSTPEGLMAGVKRRPLVPVAPATRRQYNGTRAEGSRPGDFGTRSRRTEKLDQQVRRLPPLDRTADSPYQTQGFTTAADGPIPIYPSTHDH